MDCREARTEDAGYLAKYIAKSNQITAALLELGFTRTWSRSRSWPVERFRLLATVEKSWKKISPHYPGDWKEMKTNRMTTKEWIEWTEENPFLSVGTDLNWEMENENNQRKREATATAVYNRIRGFNAYQAKDDSDEIGASGGGPRGRVVSGPGWRKVVRGAR